MRIFINVFLVLCIMLEAQKIEASSDKIQSEAIAQSIDLNQIATIKPHANLSEDAKKAKKKLNPSTRLTGSEGDLTEQQELMDVLYKGHAWVWYWENDPVYFLTYFPLFSFLVWGKFPVIYSDFYKEFGYPPATYNMLGFATKRLDPNKLLRSKESAVFPQTGCQQACVRKKVQECLNTSNKQLDACQVEAIEACAKDCK